MRIAAANWTGRLVGGAEAVMFDSLSALARAGNEVALWSEVSGPHDRPGGLVEGPAWCVEETGLDRALSALRKWSPDVVYVHAMLDPRVEDQLLTVAPGVLFAHSYYGTCISGNKTLTFPRVRPCPHRFTWTCLLRYYPRRTGGMNPVAMLRRYRLQARRLLGLRRYRFIVVSSGYMREEYLRHGLVANRVMRLPSPPLQRAPVAFLENRVRTARDPWRLLFAGRMDPLKGGAELLRAVPPIRRALGQSIDITMAGDGPSAVAWQRLADRLSMTEPGVTVKFLGWTSGERLSDAFRAADLLVMPSVWPEPFGRVGLEAGAFGVPTVAFAVGGIPEWLTDGGNGHLAPGDPPTPGGLATAVVRALEDPTHYEALRRGALAAAGAVSPEEHVQTLLGVLRRAAQRET